MTRNTLTMSLCLVAAITSTHATRAQETGAQTYSSSEPVDTDSFQIVDGFAQSFEITTSGALTTVQIEATWTGATGPVSTLPTEFAWQLFESTPGGALLDAGVLSIPANDSSASGSGLLSFTIDSVDVTAGDSLAFAIRQQSLSALFEATISWWAGDASASDPFDPYLDGHGFVRDATSNTYLTGTAAFGAEFDLRLRALVVPPADPCAGDTIAPQIVTDGVIEVPLGSSEVTISGVVHAGDLASMTVDGLPVTLSDLALQGAFSFHRPIVVSGPGPALVEIVATDLCGNTTTTTVTITFVDLCAAPELDVCTDDNTGTVFFVDLVGPAGEACLLRCATDAAGQALACDPTPTCP